MLWLEDSQPWTGLTGLRREWFVRGKGVAGVDEVGESGFGGVSNNWGLGEEQYVRSSVLL